MTLTIALTAMLLLLVLAAQCWALLHLRGQHDRIRQRIEKLSAGSEADAALSREVDAIRRLTASVFLNTRG